MVPHHLQVKEMIRSRKTTSSELTPENLSSHMWMTFQSKDTHSTASECDPDDSFDDAASLSAESIQERADAVQDDVQFSERTLPPEAFQFRNVTMYLLFLFLFSVVTIGRQGEAPYQL
eukprot:SAG31_NODE_58_length_29669_cov_20.244978_9_plen_118_part_00